MVQRGHNYAIVDEVEPALMTKRRNSRFSGPVEWSEHKFDEMNPRVKRIVDAQKNLVSLKMVLEAEAIINKGSEAKKDEIAYAGVCVLRSYRILLAKLFSEPSNKTLMQHTEIEYLRHNGSRMHEIDDEV